MKFGGSHRSPCVSPSSGLIRGCSGAAVGFKTEKNENILRIYGFEGESGGRGRWRRASANQNVAGLPMALRIGLLDAGATGVSNAWSNVQRW